MDDSRQGNNGLTPRMSVKKCYFLKDGDNNSKPYFMAIRPKDYRAGIEKLEDDLTEKCKLPAAARTIYTSRGRHEVRTLDDFSDGCFYVVSTKLRAKGVDMDAVNKSQSKKWHVAGKRSDISSSGYMSNPPPTEPRSAWASPTSTKYSSDRESGYSSSTRDSRPRPKKIYLYRNGNNKICHTMLLNSRTAMSFEQVKQDMNDMFQMNVIKIFSPEGDLVESLSGMLRGPDKFYVAGYERFKGAGDSPRDSSPEKKKPKYSRDTLVTNRLSTDRQEERRERVSKTTNQQVTVSSAQNPMPKPAPTISAPTAIPKSTLPVVLAPTRSTPTQHKGTQTHPEKKKATRGIHVQTEQVDESQKVVNPQVTQLPKKYKPLITKMPASRYESAIPLKHAQEEETPQSVVATNEEQKVSHTEIKVGNADDDRSGNITPQETSVQAGRKETNLETTDVKENIMNNNENEKEAKEQNQKDRGPNEKPQRIDEEERYAENDQVKDTDEPVKPDTPELHEKTFVIETMHGNGPGVFLEDPDLSEPAPEDKGDVLPPVSDGSNPEPKDGSSSGGDEAIQAPETVAPEPTRVSNDPINVVDPKELGKW